MALVQAHPHVGGWLCGGDCRGEIRQGWVLLFSAGWKEGPGRSSPSFFSQRTKNEGVPAPPVRESSDLIWKECVCMCCVHECV